MKSIAFVLVIIIVASTFLPLNGLVNGGLHTGSVRDGRVAQVQPFSQLPPIYITNTVIINEYTVDPLTGQTGKYGVNNPIVVTGTGHLIVENATLYFLSSVYNQLGIAVYGNLTLINSNLTVAPDVLGPNLQMFVWVGSGGSVFAKNSKIIYSGTLVVNGGSFRAVNTMISGATQGEIATAINFGMNATYAEYFRYVPAMRFSNANVYFNNVSISPMFKDEMSNITYVATAVKNINYIPFAGSGVFLLATSFNLVTPVPYYYLINNITVDIYYTTTANFTASPLDDAWVSIVTPSRGYTFYSTPSNYFTFVPNGTVGSVHFSINLSSILSAKYPIMPPLWLGYYLSNLIVYMHSYVPDDIYIYNVTVRFYTPSNVFNHTSAHIMVFSNTTAYFLNSYIDVNYNVNVTQYDALYASSGSTIFWYNTSVENSSKIVSIPFLFDQSSNIFVFRNAVIEAKNFDGTPVGHVSIGIKPYNLYTGGANISQLNVKLWNVIGSPAFSTNANGYANIPLVSDILNYTYMPNSLFVGNYNLTFFNPSGGILKNITISLMHFPLLQFTDNNYKYLINFNIPDFRIVSLNIPSPLIVGNTYVITATVTVYGNVNKINTTVEFNLTGPVNITLGTVSVLLSKNVSQYVSVVLNLQGVPYGYYSISADINPTHSIFETNYQNDYVSIPVIVYPNVDFAIENPSVYGPHLYHSVYINFSTVNLGQNKFFTATLQVYYIFNSQKFNIYNGIIASDMHNFSFNFVPNASGQYMVYVVILQQWDYNQSNNMFSYVLNFNVNYYVSNFGYFIDEQSIPAGAQHVPVELFTVVNCSVVISQDIPPMKVAFYYNGSMIGVAFVHFVPGMGAVAIIKYTVQVGRIYVFNATINYDRSYNETNYQDDGARLVLLIPAVSGYVNSLGAVPYNGTARFTGMVNVSSGMLTQVSFVLRLNGRSFSFPANDMFAYYSGVFSLNQSMEIFNITQQNVSLPYQVLITGAELPGSGYLLGAGLLLVYHPANVSIAYFGIQNITTFTVGMYIPFVIKLVNSGGISSGPVNLTFYFGASAIPVNISSIPAGAVIIDILRVNATQTGLFNTSLMFKGRSIQGPTVRIIPATYSVSATFDRTKQIGNGLVNITVFVVNQNASMEYGSPIYGKNIPVTLIFAGRTYQGITDENGVAVFTVKAPTNESGPLPVKVSLSSGGVTITSQVGVIYVTQPFPLLEFIFGLIALIIGAITYLIYNMNKKAKLKRRKVCPVCGASIYEGANVCPVCGSQLVGDIEHCPMCDTVIPKYSKYCPNCGEIFVDERDRDYNYLNEIKARYDESMDKIREEYRKTSKSEADFYTWWLTNPGFISFREYLLKVEYENKKKECPNCGAINDLSAETCINCGKQLPMEYTIPKPILQKFEMQSGNVEEQAGEKPEEPEVQAGPVGERKEKKKRGFFRR